MRTRFLTFGLLAAILLAGKLFAQSTPNNWAGTDTTVTVPNDLEDGNLLLAPKAIRQLTTVGGAVADIPAFTSAAIQLAVDAAAQRGGGTVQLSPGTYEISAPIRLASNITLVGAGDSTLLRKIGGYRSSLTVDGDYGMVKVTVQDARGFKPGMGVQISDSQYSSDYDVTVATIVQIEGNTLFLDHPTLRDYDCGHHAVVSNACSIVEAVGVDNVHIGNFTIIGFRETNDLLGGCRGGAIYLSRASNCLVDNVKAKDFNGDVFSWQCTLDVTVRRCEASFSSGKGFHPGTGCENSIIEECSSHHNLDGIFLCWRVKKSIIRNNVLFSNDRDGISVNKKDTDNRFSGNHIYSNGRDGVWFNDYNETNNSHRNIFTQNVIEDNGTKGSGCGIFINKNLRDIVIRNNTIRDNGSKTQKYGVLISQGSLNIQVRDNSMNGHADGDIVRR